jgi:hypothetical protein
MKYSTEMTKRICDLLRDGNTQKTSAIASGISEDTFYTWMKEIPEFSESVKKAEEEAVARNVAIIKTAANDHWTAAAWWLERRRRDDFGKNEKVDITSNGKELAAPIVQFVMPSNGTEASHQD